MAKPSSRPSPRQRGRTVLSQRPSWKPLVAIVGGIGILLALLLVLRQRSPDQAPALPAVSVPTTASLAPSAPAVGAIGQPVLADGQRVTILKATWVAAQGSMLPLKSNTRYLLVDVRVENVSRPTALPVNRLYFTATDADGTVVYNTPSGLATDLHNATLTQGEERSGTVAFALPSSSTPVTLTYTVVTPGAPAPVVVVIPPDS